MRDVCDGLDNNCNGVVDEFLATTRYRDADADGYSTGATTSMCLPSFTGGLVAYYSFDTGTGTDDSGYGNTGSVLNGITFATGKVGKAARFDGINDYIDFGNPGLSSLTNSTISFWRKAPASPKSWMIFK